MGAINVLANGVSSLPAADKAGTLDWLGLDGFKHGLDHGVVMAIDFAAHRRQQAVLFQERWVISRTVLAASIRMMDHAR